MAAILQRYHVNALNISIRHAKQDPGTWLAWAKTDVFAFVLYYKQGITEIDKNKVAIWTRELIDAVLAFNGSYYLPYQTHATHAQFHKAYPRAKEFFKLKKNLDASYQLQNQLWNKYYLEEKIIIQKNSEFKTLLSNPIYHDKLYLFLQNIFHLFNEDKFFSLIKKCAQKNDSDKEIYSAIGTQLLLLPRLDAFADAALQLADLHVQFLEIAGNNAFISLSIIISVHEINPCSSCTVLFKQRILTRPGHVRALIAVPISYLSRALRIYQQHHIAIEHIYDY